MAHTRDVTELLTELSNGDPSVMERLMPVVYDELRQLAERYLYHERSGHTLQATALVHEAYLRLVDQKNVQWQNRSHFFGVAAQMMRRILIDHARQRHAAKREGGQKISLDDVCTLSNRPDVSLIMLDEALTSLALIDRQKSRIVELRFFGGLSIEEVAEVLGTSTRTVMRHWQVAKTWLYREIQRQEK